MAPASASKPIPSSFESDYLELRRDEWNDIVDDSSQCMRISHQKEVEYLSSQNANLAEYLKLHPEMAHELMVPSGFKERTIRRYERMLCGERSLSSQNGLLDEAQMNEEIFTAMMHRPFNVLKNPEGVPQPSWYELVKHVHKANDEARQFEHRETGDLVRVVVYGSQEIQVTERDWRLMWDHVACRFTAIPFGDPDAVECRALHAAWAELYEIPTTWNTWHFPIGQKIQILMQQIEGRIGGLHRRNKTHDCCTDPGHHELFGLGFREYLTKREAAAIVIEHRKAKGGSLHACNYDPAVMELLNVEEKVEQGCIKFVQRPGSEPKSEEVAKGALVEVDDRTKERAAEVYHTLSKTDLRTGLNLAEDTTEDGGSGKLFMVEEEDEDLCALEHIESEDTSMTGSV